MPPPKQTRKPMGRTSRGTKTVDRKKQPLGKNAPTSTGPPEGSAGGGDALGLHSLHEEDEMMTFIQEVAKHEDAIVVPVDVRKGSLIAGQKLFKLGPDYIDEDYFECTPVPLYEHMVPMLDYDTYLEKTPEEIVPAPTVIVRPVAQEEVPLMDWDPNLTDLEEDCFFQEILTFPTSKLAHILPRQKKRDQVRKRRVKVFKPSGEFVVKTRVYIDLVETASVFLLEIKGSLVLESNENIDVVRDKNAKYLEIVARHAEELAEQKTLPCHNQTQTFENIKLNAYTDYRIQGSADVGTECHRFEVVDDCNRLAEAIEASNETDNAQQVTGVTGPMDGLIKKVELGTYMRQVNANKQLLMEEASEDELPMSDDEDEFEIKMPLQTVYQKKRRRAEQHGLRMYPDISFSTLTLERIICMDANQVIQADMRGFTQPEVKVEIVAAVEETAEEVIDEDAMVDLIIQQHRMQESNEKQDGVQVDQDMVIILPPEITDAELKKIQRELDGEEEGGAEAEEAPAVVKQEVVKVEEQVATVVVADEPEDDLFDMDMERGGLDLDDIKVLIGDDLTGDAQAEGEGQENAGKNEEGYADKYPFDELGADGLLLGNMRCEWDERAEKAMDAKEEALLGKESEEVILDEKLTLPAATGEEEVVVVVTAMPPDPAQITIDKKEMFQELGYNFPELAQHQLALEQTKEQDTAQEVVDEDDISDPSDGDDDSRLSDHKGFEEDLECSSDALSDENDSAGHLFKEMVARRSSVNKLNLFGLQDKHSEMTHYLNEHTDTGPYLQNFWHLKTPLASGKEVTDIALHPSNGNLIGVSYGTCRFGNDHEKGLVCIWNAKNSRTPERIYHLKSPATSLAFSQFTPSILAVGTLDGNIILYDVRESQVVILVSTLTQDDKHLGPVWMVYWLVEEDSANEASVSESLMSLGDDGYLKKWSKGLESTDVMTVLRSTMMIPGRKEKRSEALITTLSNAYTVCFFPDNTELFLLGTEEGFIHKCAVAYKDQYVSTFIGHTGPVYRICFSSFESSVFISCGGDWTVKIWKTDHPSPLLSMNTGYRTIFDVACSLYSSTVFICCAEFNIEVWDLSINTLEPVVQEKLPNDVGLRKVAFNGALNSVIIGDDEGGIYIFGIRNFPKPKVGLDAQNEALMEALLPGYYKKRPKESTNDMVNSTTSINLKGRLSKLNKGGSTTSNRGDGRSDDYGRVKSIKQNRP